MTAFPAEVLIGMLDSQQMLTGFVIQGFWLVVAIILYQFMWRRGVGHYEAVGG